MTPQTLSILQPALQFDLAEEGPRRVALAKWIARADNPLTARVLVNRIWQYHFGHGLVDTPSDFGINGALPTHPELLDWLTTEFLQQQWSIKQLHRQIVTSETFPHSVILSRVVARTM